MPQKKKAPSVERKFQLIILIRQISSNKRILIPVIFAFLGMVLSVYTMFSTVLEWRTAKHPQPDSEKWGNIVFNTPETIPLDEGQVIKLLLSPKKTGEELKKMLQEEGSLETATIKISDQMEANLVGSEFQITKVTPERQRISAGEETTWKWEIKPQKLGKQHLHLTINILIPVGDKEQLHSIRTFQKEIEVHVSLYSRVSNFVGNNWQWLWTAILIPIAGWIWTRRRKKEQKRPWETV